MAHRKAGTAPVRDKGPVKIKPGDFEPPTNTKTVPIDDPPQGSPLRDTSAACSPGGPKNPARR
jgi:hypothetical protein